MSRIFAALIDAIRFSRSYQRLARITDDAARARPHDTQETLARAWEEAERARSHADCRERNASKDTPKGSSPSLHVALMAKPTETDFPG